MPISTPAQITVPFAASSAQRNSIPANSDQINGKAGYDLGFPPINMTPKTAGGIPPFGQDFNGILFDLSAALQYAQSGGGYPYTSAFATAIGGYAAGAIVVNTAKTGYWLNVLAGNTSNPDTGGAGWIPLSSSGIVGGSRNCRAYLSTASASISISADEITLKYSVAGPGITLGSFSQTLNTGSIGAGGMDTGLAPVSGDLAIYAIYNPATGAKALLGQTAPSALVTETYTGSFLPAGYSMSCLVAVWRTNASRQLIQGRLLGRRVSIVGASMLSLSGAGITTPTAFFTGNAVPACSKEIDVNVSANETAAGTGVQLFITSDVIGLDLVTSVAAVAGTASTSLAVTRGRCMVNIAGNLVYYMASTNAGQFSCSAVAYTF